MLPESKSVPDAFDAAIRPDLVEPGTQGPLAQGTIKLFHPVVRYVCRRPLRGRCLSLCLAILLYGSGSAMGHRSPELKPEPALDFVAEAFDRYPVVALSELHGNRESAAFLAMLIRHEGFSRRVNDIVVEFGNAAYQPVVDRYISGAPVGRDELRGTWENTTQISGIWLLPMYEAILADIRRVNATLPAGRRYRVLLGDPPINWSKVTSPADDDMNDWRDAHFAWVVEHYVLASNRRALLFVGGGHISRRVIFPHSLIHLLDSRFPGKTLVVAALNPARVEPVVAMAMSAWPIPSAATVRGTWVGRSDVQTLGFTFSRGLVQDDVDALLALSTAPLVSDPAPDVDESANGELQRRRRLAQATLPFRGGLIRFEANTTQLTASSSAPLQQVLSELLRDRDRAVLVKAFADARERHPLRLSTERADSVAEWLVTRGISRDRVESRGCGAKRPLWADNTADHDAANRRIEIVTKTPTADCEPPRSFDHFWRP
jgi:outer membrane protein OmpA-like peptidoglycan-associated protein